MTTPIAPPAGFGLELDAVPPKPALLPVEPLSLPSFPEESPPAEVQPALQAPPMEGWAPDAGAPPLDWPSSLGAPPTSKPIETN